MMAKKKEVNIVEEVKYQTTEVAESVLHNATDAVKKGMKHHGDTEASFSMIAELWTTYIKHIAIIRGFNGVDPDQVAQMMVLLKIGRSAYGHGKDNYVDAAGYSALAAMLQPLGGKDDE